MKQNKKRKQKVIAICVLAFLFATAIVFFKDVVYPKIHTRKIYLNTHIGMERIPFSKSDIITQPVKMNTTTISGIALGIYGTEENKDATIDVRLLKENKKQIYQWKIKGQELSKEGYTVLMMDKMTDVLNGGVFQIIVSTDADHETPFLVAKPPEEYPEGMPEDTLPEGVTRGKMDKPEIAYQVLGDSLHAFLYIYLIIIGCLTLVFIWVIVGAIRQWKVETIFVGAAVWLGIIYMIIMPPFSVPDEQLHFTTCYARSSKILGRPVVTEDNQTIGDSAMERANNELRTKATDDRAVRYFKEMFRPSKPYSSKAVLMEHPMQSKHLGYIGQVTGLVIGRLLKLSGFRLIVLGRCLSYLLYLLLVYAAISLMPTHKMMLMIVSLLPTSMQEAISYSYDGLVNALCFLTIAYIFHLAYEKDKVTIKDGICLFLIVALMAPIKVIYSLLVVLIVLIPKEKFSSNKRRFQFYGAMAVSAFGSVLVLRLVNLSQLVKTADVGVGQAPGYTLEMVFQYPLHTLAIVLRTVVRWSSFYIESMIGQNMGWLTIRVDVGLILLFVVLLLLVSLSSENTCGRTQRVFSTKEKIVLFFVCAAITGGIMAALLLDVTRSNAWFIEGIQGRYFLPILPCLLVLFSGESVVIKKRVDFGVLLFWMMIEFEYTLSFVRAMEGV